MPEIRQEPTKAEMEKDTVYIHGFERRLKSISPLSFPIFQSSTFENPGLGKECLYSYSRCKNPTRNALEEAAAKAEGAKYAFAFSSGLSAITAVFSLLSKGDHVVLSDDIYGGTYRLLNVLFAKFGIECTIADPENEEELTGAFRENTKLLFIETPTNPMCKIADIAFCAELSHKHGALLCVDNTFLTPYLQKPFLFGADIVVHSATKYLSGHNDTSCGLCLVNSDALYERLDYISRTEGTAASPFDSWLVLRGMKTLSLRMKKHCENGQTVAEWLRRNRNVERVYYAGAKSGREAEIMAKQTSGCGGMISFRLKYPSLAQSVLSGGRIIRFAESLGGTESLITYPITQTHATTPVSLQKKLGIDESLIRLSCGIEDAKDIIADLERTLGKNL